MMYKSYYHKPPRKTFFSYLLPFLIIISIFIIFVLAYNFWQKKKDLLLPKETQAAYLSIEQGAVEVLLWGTEQWRKAPDQIKLFQGDSIRTNPGSRAQVLFFDKSILRFDSNTKATLSQMKKAGDTRAVALLLNNGQVWAKIEKADSESTFRIKTDYFDAGSKGGTLVVGEDTLRALEGEAEVYILDASEKIKKVNLGVGQEIKVGEEVVKKIKDESEIDLVKAISDTFKESAFYIWNQKKDGKIAVIEGEEEDAEKPLPTEEETKVSAEKGALAVKIISPQEDDIFNSSDIKVEGTILEGEAGRIYINGVPAYISNNSFSLEKVPLNKEGTNLIEITYKDKKGIEGKLKTVRVIKDTVFPESPKILEPKIPSPEAPIEVSETTQNIKGEASLDTYKIMVNDYSLQKYLPGNKEWLYIASAKIGNLVPGKNEYKVVAIDEAGNKSLPANIILVLTGADVLTDTTEKEVEEKKEAESKVMIVEGGDKLTLDAPLKAKDTYYTSQTKITISGNTPKNTSYFLINDYKLSLYKAGDEKWYYTASSDYNNLKPKGNTYIVSAFDENNVKLDEINFAIYLETEIFAPKITIPTEENIYTTTLDVITLGGYASVLSKAVYINDLLLSSYTSFSREWSKTINLEKGENIFRVKAEDSVGKMTGEAVIKIVRE